MCPCHDARAALWFRRLPLYYAVLILRSGPGDACAGRHPHLDQMVDSGRLDQLVDCGGGGRVGWQLMFNGCDLTILSVPYR